MAVVKVGCKISILFAVISFLALSCQRQSLEEPFQFIAHVPITIDWSESLLQEKNIANVSICAYPTDGSEPIKLLSDNIYFNVLELPIGEYDILVNNELLGDIKGLESVGVNKFSEIRSHIIPVAKPEVLYDTLRSGDVVAENHNLIATWATRGLVVNSQMVELTRSKQYELYIAEAKSKSGSKTKGLAQKSVRKTEDDELFPTLPDVPMSNSSKADIEAVTKALESLSKVYPQCENTVLHFNVRVANLNNAMRVEALLRGTEYGAYLTSDKREEYEAKRVVYVNRVTSRTFDDPNNGIDGYMNLTVNTFGKGGIGDRYSIDFSCALNDGRVMKFSIDITDHILKAGNSKYITIDLGTLDEPAITLPACGDAGFNVGDWDDEIIVDIC